MIVAAIGVSIPYSQGETATASEALAGTSATGRDFQFCLEISQEFSLARY